MKLKYLLKMLELEMICCSEKHNVFLKTQDLENHTYCKKYVGISSTCVSSKFVVIVNILLVYVMRNP